MSSSMTQNKLVVFDLDDTLYKEVDYLKSAYNEIADGVASQCKRTDVYEKMWKWWQAGDNVFERLIKEYELENTISDFLKKYRLHVPQIQLDKATLNVLKQLKRYCVLGMITDGRSVTQHHKLQALDIEVFFDECDVLISEETGWTKPMEQPYLKLMERYPLCSYYYIGDNPLKDFLAPNRLGWSTICLLDDGRNIHKQDFGLDCDYLPQIKIKNISELSDIIK